MAKILSFLILAYQKVSWLLFPRCCRFHPSCSSYALEAIEKHGACKGLIKTMLRIFRCSPLSRGGYDPVR